jgi:hypothetical protein
MGTQWERTTATLTNECPTCGTASQVQLNVVKTRQGPRFVCSGCKGKVVKLYRPPGAAWNDWKCQKCHRLGYSTQYRKERRVQGLNPFEFTGFG